MTNKEYKKTILDMQYDGFYRFYPKMRMSYSCMDLPFCEDMIMYLKGERAIPITEAMRQGTKAHEILEIAGLTADEQKEIFGKEVKFEREKKIVKSVNAWLDFVGVIDVAGDDFLLDYKCTKNKLNGRYDKQLNVYNDMFFNGKKKYGYIVQIGAKGQILDKRKILLKKGDTKKEVKFYANAIFDKLLDSMQKEFLINY